MHVSLKIGIVKADDFRAMIYKQGFLEYEPLHVQTNKMTCGPSDI